MKPVAAPARRDLASHLEEPEITDGRLARQWASVERRLPNPRAARITPARVAVWMLPAACLAMCLWLGLGPHRTLPGSGALVESSSAPLALQLRDGSSLELAAQTRLRVLRDQPTAVELEIAEGRASFDVKHVKGRAFDVRAGIVTVHVVGTQFHVVKAVRREGMEIQVAVKRGVVEVQRSDRDGDTRRIAAGETWSVWVPADPKAPASKPKLTAAATPTAAAEAEAAPAANGGQDARPHDVQASQVSNEVLEPTDLIIDPSEVPEQRHASARPFKEDKPRAFRAPTAALEPRLATESAQALFMRANIARRSGRMEDAASAYAELLKRFPRDNRAGVSAFELGRIRMDALSDPKGAASAFSEALRLSHRAELREDALARLAIAGEAIGDRDMCQKARSRYLTDYPSGVHVGSLAVLCGNAKP